MHTKPSGEFDAGDRTGRLPARLPLDFKAFETAWRESLGAKAPVPAQQ